MDSRIVRMTAEVADIEYIVTDTVSEAFLLESNLIKEHRPRFNIRLRDDKSYPFVKITLGEDFPRIVRTRKLSRDGSRYFGPYASASSVDETLKLLRRIFPFRTCNLDIPEGKRVLERPCLLYYIKRCQGPCIEAIEKADYRATIDRVVDFLEGRQEGIAAELRGEMQDHSRALRYEQAAIARDKLRAVERTIEQQKVAAYSRAEQDVIGIAREEGEACLQLFVIRNGKMIGREHFIVEGARDMTDAEVLGSFLPQYYAATERPPREVVLPCGPPRFEGRADDPGARRQAPAGGARHAERGRGPVPRACRVAGGRRQARRSARGTCHRAGAGPGAGADRVLRHEQHPGHQRGRQHGRLRERAPRAARIPALPDPIRRDARRLPDDG
jgi:excinuclease UvrABC nuclease subunit